MSNPLPIPLLTLKKPPFTSAYIHSKMNNSKGRRTAAFYIQCNLHPSPWHATTKGDRAQGKTGGAPRKSSP